jgi:hypothetical protein
VKETTYSFYTIITPIGIGCLENIAEITSTHGIKKNVSIILFSGIYSEKYHNNHRIENDITKIEVLVNYKLF